MSTFLVKNATILVTMDDHQREIASGGLFIRDGFIEQVGTAAELPNTADEILDLKGQADETEAEEVINDPKEKELETT